MANTLSNSGRNGFALGSWSWLTGTWVPYILGSFAAVGGLATYQKLSDFGAAVLAARGTYLTGLAATRGECIAASTIIGAVGSVSGGPTGVYVGLFLEASAAVPASQLSWFVGLIDTASVTPFLPNAGDIQILWDPSSNPVSRVFTL